MNPTVKKILVIAIKHAVNAILTNAGLMAMLHNVFNTSTHNGLVNIGKLTLSVVAAREACVWVPLLLKWTTTNSDPDSVEDGKSQTPKEKP